MEELMQLISTESVLIVAAVGTFIVKGISILSVVLRKELDFWQELRHKKKRLSFKIYERKKTLEIENLEKSGNSNSITDALEIIRALKNIREMFDFRLAAIGVFHNGVSKWFRNYSIRFEESRGNDISKIDSFQSKPLSPFYEQIEDFGKKEFFMYNKASNRPALVNQHFSSGNVDKVIVIPLLVDENKVDVDYRLIKIRKNGLAMVAVGFMLLEIDDKTTLDDKDDLVKILNVKEKILNLYGNNPVIFG